MSATRASSATVRGRRTTQPVERTSPRLRKGIAYLLLCIGLPLVLMGALSGVAAAAPKWRIEALSNPTVAPGAQQQYIVQLQNVGDGLAPQTTSGDFGNCDPLSPPPSDLAQCYRITATFPPGMTPLSATGITGSSCVVDAGPRTITCSVSGSDPSEQLRPYEQPGGSREMTVVAEVDPAASGTLTASFEVAGGNVGTASTVDATVVDSAAPEFGIGEFDAQVMADADGAPFTQASGHPYAASTSIEFNSIDVPNFFIGTLWPVEPTKDIVVDLPPGFVGNPTVVDQCSTAELANGSGVEVRSLCSPSSQVGVTYVRVNAVGATSFRGPIPVFSLVPPPGVPARFGFNILGTVVVLDAKLRSEGDYGLSVVVSNISQGLEIQGTSLTFWGVPADPSHTAERACPGELSPAQGGPSCQSGQPPRAFLRNPTACTPAGVGLPTTIRMSSWANPGLFKAKTIQSHLPAAYPAAPEDWGPPQGPTGCERVPFNPTLRGTPPEDAKAGQPAGFSFDLSVPQNDDPASIGSGDLKKAVVTLPRGLQVSPSSADGLAACSPGQIGLDDANDPTCPEAAKIGSLTITTPLLRQQLTGSIYLATPFDNPFNKLIAIYLVARGPGLIVKLPGSVDLNQGTKGPMVATFDDNPQLPFSNLHLEFKGGPRAPLVMPRCGTYRVTAELTSWSGKTTPTSSEFTLGTDGKGRDCPAEFTPGFEAGTRTSAAGKSSPFQLRLTRDDEDQQLQGLSLDMPQGMLGRIADVQLCGDAAAGNGTCSDASKVGSVTVGAGAGTNPFYITNGRVYITGPYKGAPFGLSVVVPAVAGPFDLGTVVVRQALFVDKHTSELRVVSDPLPTELQGIQLDVRDVRVAVDRPGFFLNPTSCAEKKITGTIQSTEGRTAGVASRFQAYDCQALPVRPKMVLTVGKRGRTGRNSSTPFTARLTQTPGQANLRSVRVVLPTTINARLDVVNRACTRAEFEAANCEKARAGSAVAVTPLLKDPLRGNAYFVRNGHPIPDLFVALEGQVDFDLIGRVSIPKSKYLGTTFDMVPDVPITSFTLSLVAGRQGPVGTTTNLCSSRGRNAEAKIDFVGQNGKTVFVDQKLQIRGCRAKRSGRRGRGRRGRRR